jgi:hypothetical protein
MNARAQALAEQIQTFNRDMVDFVQNCSDTDWQRVCKTEDWTVGVVARHVGDGHYRVVELAKMIIAGSPLPDWSMEAVVQMGNDHAREHADCTREEVLAILESNAARLCDFIAALTGDELDRQGSMALVGGDISVQRILERLILQSGGDHLKSIRATLAG